MARSIAVDRAIAFAISGVQEAVQREYVAAVKRELAAIETEHRPSSTRQWVDGVEGRPIEEVDAFGRIVVQFRYWDLVIKDALEILRATSPVDTGTYQASHNVFLPDGTPMGNVVLKGMAPKLSDPMSMAVAGEVTSIIIAPTVAYARVIESGMAGKKPWSSQPQVPLKGVYFNAVEAIRRRWAGVILVRFEWQELSVNDDPYYARQPAMVLEHVV